MSSGLQHKMYNFEVAPPAIVWEKVAAELDQADLQLKFPSHLKNISVNPPAHIWPHIASALDEPALIKDYSTKLSGIEVVPTPDAWNKIKTTLDAEHESVIPIQRRVLPFIKYAAAAAVIILFVWGGLTLFNNQSTEKVVVKQGTKEPATNIPSVTISNESQATNIAEIPIITTSDEVRNDAALEASKKTYAKLDASETHSKIKNAANFYFTSDENEYPAPDFANRITSEPVESACTDISCRYIMLLTPDGNIIRMSKKLSGLVCCVSGEEQDKGCVDQLKKWREKIANPSASHTSGNFLDILSMVNAMQEK